MAKLYPLIIPSKYRRILPDIAGGVGTPRLIYDPERGCWVLFFTGWVNAKKREVFVAEVEKDFTISSIKKILSAPPTRDAVNAMYNPWIDGYTILTTEGGPLYIRHLDRDFNVVAEKKLVDGMQDSGAGILTLMGGYSEENPNAVIFYPKREKVLMRLVKRVDDLNLLELGPAKTFSWWEEPNDVIDAFRTNHRFGVLVEYFTDKQNWRSRIALSGDYFTEEIRALSAPLPLPFNDAYGNYGHPSFTTGPDGKPKIMFSFFFSHAPPFPITDYSKQWRHEIWVWEPDIDIFDPRTYGVMSDKVKEEEVVYDLMGAKKLVLVSKGATVELLEASSIPDLKAGDYVKTVYEVKGKTVIEDPLNVVKISHHGLTMSILAYY